MNKLLEIKSEFGHVFSGNKIKIWDSITPLIVFLIINQLYSLNLAVALSIVSGILFSSYRLITKEKLSYSIAGLAVAVIAAGLAFLSKSSTAFFIPGLITSLITIVLCFGSVIIKKPIAAWSSRITRRWPKNWYKLDAVRPAYSEVTLFWGVAFGLRTLLELWLLIQNAINAAGAVKIFLGWPYTIAVLIISYFYGTWRLKNLQGPSVDEFVAGSPSPWKGQIKGF